MHATYTIMMQFHAFCALAVSITMFAKLTFLTMLLYTVRLKNVKVVHYTQCPRLRVQPYKQTSADRPTLARPTHSATPPPPPMAADL